jgi:hypothetical protein
MVRLLPSIPKTRAIRESRSATRNTILASSPAANAMPPHPGTAALSVKYLP